jgi:hypothetical protein
VWALNLLSIRSNIGFGPNDLASEEVNNGIAHLNFSSPFGLRDVDSLTTTLNTQDLVVSYQYWGAIPYPVTENSSKLPVNVALGNDPKHFATHAITKSRPPHIRPYKLS